MRTVTDRLAKLEASNDEHEDRISTSEKLISGLDRALVQVIGRVSRLERIARGISDEPEVDRVVPGYPEEKITVREACRRRMPLDGADAQALESALTMTEHERNRAVAAIKALLDTEQYPLPKSVIEKARRILESRGVA